MRSRTPILILVLVLILVVVGVVLFLVNQNGGLILPNNNPVAVNGASGTTAPPTAIVLTATPINLVEVVVAVQDLPRGYRIPPYVPGSVSNAIGLENLPADNVPKLAVTVTDLKNPQATIDQVVGKIARTDIARQSPILYTTIVDDLTAIAKVGSDAALIVPSGTRAIAVPIDRFSGVGFSMRDGDYVDILASFIYSDVDPAFQSALPNKENLIVLTTDSQGNEKISFLGLPSGRIENYPVEGLPEAIAVSPSESQRPRLTTGLIIQNALVIHVGLFPLEGAFIGSTPTAVEPTAEPAQAGSTAASSGSNATVVPSPTPALPDMVTIAVSPQDANVLAWLNDARIPLTFTMHNPQDVNRANTQPVTLSYMVQTYGVTAPDRLNFALDPAIRSVRSITSSTLQPFYEPYGGAPGSSGSSGTIATNGG